jgi:hypothetical protein
MKSDLRTRLKRLEEEAELDGRFEALLCRLEALPDSMAERRNRAKVEVAAILRQGAKR